MSSPQGRALRIGVFVLLGLGLVAGAVLLTAGGRLFRQKDTVVMHFHGSVYGLQVGAPVVFRGVQLGGVTAIGLAYDSSNDQFTIPVTAELDRDTVHQRQADGQPGHTTLTLPALITKGLSAQLAMQSLLTGQLYVDLDLRPNRPQATSTHDPRLTEIPTSATAIQNLKAQLDGMDFRRLLDDVSAMAGALRQITTGPALQATLADLHGLSTNLRQLSARLDRQVDPLARSAQQTLGDARALMGSLQGSNGQLRDTLGRFGRTADQASALLA
ncbi:MAG: mammalian cell entry protein, partial [Burkholderiales bacterium PBB5]